MPEGATGVNFSVQATQDAADEPNEPFTVTLSDPVRATIETASVTTNIVDDDTPALSIGNAGAVDEGDTATFTVSLSPAGASPVTVNYQTANGTAAAPGDFTAKGSTPLTFAPGEVSKTVTVQTLDETPALDEDNETFTVTLSGASSNASIADGTGTATITDDDAEVSIASISNTTVVEGNTGTVDATITVTLSAASGKTVTVPFLTSPGTATAPADYEAQTGNLVFNPGQTSRPIVIKVKGDTLFEPDEKFTVGITDPVNGAPGADNLGEITITDDDSTPIPTLTNPSILEGNSGLADLVFEASLPAPHAAVTFNYRTVADTANTSDYDAASGSKLFPANSGTTPTKVPITIKVKGDLLDEVDETLKLELLNATTDAVVRTATGTIRNDDNNTKIAVGDASSDEPGTLTFPVTLSQASAREVKISWATADGTAAAGSDYTGGGGTLTFAPGDTSKNIDVAVIGDSVTEENETMKVVLSGPVGVPEANVLDGEGAGTIIDKNAPPSLSISDTLRTRGRGRDIHGLAGGHDPADGHGPVQHRRRHGEGRLRLRRPHRHPHVRAGREVEDGRSLDQRRHGGRARRGVLRRDRRRHQRGDHQEPGRRIDRGQRSPGRPRDDDPKKPVAKPVAVQVPRMILGPRTVSIGANGMARMLVTCQKLSPIGCAGSVELERASKPLLKLGKKTFTVKKGAKGYASIKLSLKSLKLLQKNGTMRAKVVVLVKTSGKAMKVSPGVITLKATRALKNAKLKAPPPSPKVIVDP